jgi:hypothetical protein
MYKFWTSSSSRQPAYRHLNAEPVSNTRDWACDGDLKIPEKNPTANESHNVGLRPICTQIALLVLAFICAIETSALVLQHYDSTSELGQLIGSPVPSGRN